MSKENQKLVDLIEYWLEDDELDGGDALMSVATIADLVEEHGDVMVSMKGFLELLKEEQE